MDATATPKTSRVICPDSLCQQSENCNDDIFDDESDEKENEEIEESSDDGYLEDDIPDGNDEKEIEKLNKEAIESILANLVDDGDDEHVESSEMECDYSGKAASLQQESESSSNSSSGDSSFTSPSTYRTPISSRPTRMDLALERVGKEGALKYMGTAPLWSLSTIKKHVWVERLLTRWCEKVERRVWPLEWDVARGFVLFCGKECKYSLTSIIHVIVPSIKRMSIEKRNRKLNKRTKAAINEAIHSLKYDKEVKKRGKEREPALLKDVERIVTFMPKTLDSKEMEAALYLMSVQTGARAITLSSVLLSDIVRVMSSNESGKLLVTLRYNRTKGSSNWNHEITIEGQEEEEKPTDAVYWLSKYLQKRINIKLSEFEKRKNEVDLNQTLFTLSTDAMRERFKARAEQAGYPRSLFSFHSLRSGFICTALIKAGTNKVEQKAVLESTALIAGWVPYRLAQMGYIKKVARRVIVSSRLVNEDEEGKKLSEIDKTMLGLEAFHGIELRVSDKMSAPMRMFEERVIERMKKFFGTDVVERAKSLRYRRSGSMEMCLMKENLKKYAEDVFRNSKGFGDKKHAWSYKGSAFIYTVRIYIRDRIENIGANPIEVADEFCGFAEKKTSKEDVRKYSKKEKVVDENKKTDENEENRKTAENEIIENEKENTGKKSFSERERNEKNNLKRIRWSDEDDKLVIEMFDEGKRASDIVKHFPFRTKQHIDDHIRVLKKKGKIVKKPPPSMKELMRTIKETPKKKEEEEESVEKRKKKRKIMNDDDYEESKERGRKRKRREVDEEDWMFEDEEERICKWYYPQANKRLKRSEDGSEWVRGGEEEEEEEVAEVEKKVE
ncbi:uncharacterized protein MONOS_15150 [Monocercomonoides exilis]|uniref:uncharacterized protein n=1 Tax=Monocercomonoides exilis TaxID=2049356 RepID=UPI003559D572|nr:hypothetical protein MONOS_15150 [Monocercomonoides exilis]|eukprot:MONOS_15150.1-p1 / transcript=MONOS_15150.1 / gene=MONOS_15150 / organism=Monocercomonoides_exilis_PA203 / gene_product=unspecified product / transcript_product=unspecified product / location=Mono_scaffold01156:5389-7914(-) / protein_length=842 / sequence_SO=supercontig / SO=protein_coding / is_pseudo=false